VCALQLVIAPLLFRPCLGSVPKLTFSFLLCFSIASFHLTNNGDHDDACMPLYSYDHRHVLHYAMERPSTPPVRGFSSQRSYVKDHLQPAAAAAAETGFALASVPEKPDAPAYETVAVAPVRPAAHATVSSI
jgi:hypothetical protein